MGQDGDQSQLDDLGQGVGDGVVGDQAGELDQDVPGAAERHVPSQGHRTGDRPIEHDLGATMQPGIAGACGAERFEGAMMRWRGVLLRLGRLEGEESGTHR